MKTRAALVVVLALSSPGALARAPVATAGAELDADLASALAGAEGMAGADPREACRRVLVLAASKDAFTDAQRPLWAPRAAALLLAASRALLDDDAAHAAACADGAGSLHEPARAQAAAVLVDAARRSSGSDALGLARRASDLDPTSSEAATLDDDLSRNWLALPGASVMAVGFGLSLSSWFWGPFLYQAVDPTADLTSNNPLAFLSFAAAAAVGASVTLAGWGIGQLGQPAAPTLPDELPALP